MGCSASRLEDLEVVQLCKDRKNFIKEALEQRSKFASGHIAYIQSLKRVSMALNRFVNGDYSKPDLLLLPFDPYITPPLIPTKRPSLEIHNFHAAKYLRSGGSASISVQERVPPVETARVESHFRMGNGNAEFGEVRYMKSGTSPAPVTVQERHQPAEAIRIESYFPGYGSEGFFDASSSSYSNMTSSSSYDNGSGVNMNSSYSPPPPDNSHWDLFWNPFSSLGSYSYTYPNPSYNSGYDRMVSDDDVAGLQRVREQEGIPELEEDISSVELESDESESEFRSKNIKQELKGFQNKGMDSVEVVPDATSRGVNVELNAGAEKKDLMQQVEGDSNSKKQVEVEEKLGFTVYLNRRPVSLAEVVREIELQFERASDAAHEITGLLEAGQVILSNKLSSTPTPSDLAARMLNPVALFRSGSSSSRFFVGSSRSSSREDAFDSGSCCSDDSEISSGHHSTLDRLYTWEKKLYHEVKAGEKMKIEYEKKLQQLRKQDMTGEEASSVDRTRAALRNLETRLKLSFQSVQSISRRIETLRDGELHPQLMDLLPGLERMWRAISDCHRIQKRAIDQAKPLLFSSCFLDPAMSVTVTPPHVGPAAAALQSELKTWRQAFSAWVSAQRAYASALSGWAQRCCGARNDDGSPQVFRTCWRWARGMDGVSGAQVMDGLDFFAAGIGSVCAGLGAEEKEKEAVVEMVGRVVFAGLSVVVSALADYAADSADSYELVLRKCNQQGENDGGAKL